MVTQAQERAKKFAAGLDVAARFYLEFLSKSEVSASVRRVPLQYLPISLSSVLLDLRLIRSVYAFLIRVCFFQQYSLLLLG